MVQSITEEQKRKIIGLIQVIVPNAIIILFGSHARGTQRPGSDIDLAIDAGHPLGLHELGELIGVLEGTNLPYTIDIVDLHTTSEKLRESIKQEGIIWTS
jgi:uncharacterized protein